MFICIWLVQILRDAQGCLYVAPFPTFIGSTGFTCAKWNYAERSCLLMTTTHKHASLFDKSLFIDNQFTMDGKCGIWWGWKRALFETWTLCRNGTFWMTGVIYLDALFRFPHKPWLVVKFLSCKKKKLEIGSYWSVSRFAYRSWHAAFVCHSLNSNAMIRPPQRRPPA